MAATLTIEEERGTYVETRHQHPHKGYYAGDFSQVPVQEPASDDFYLAGSTTQSGPGTMMLSWPSANFTKYGGPPSLPRTSRISATTSTEPTFLP
jgi:hypothetical protein